MCNLLFCDHSKVEKVTTRKLSPGPYFAHFEYLRSTEGRSQELNLSRLSPGPSPVRNLHFVVKEEKHFFYCPEVVPEIKCPSFESFFKILSSEGFVYNVKVE